MNTYPPAPTTCMSVVSGPFKYTYWWFENNEMKPTEELFNLKNDPLELTNLVQLPEHRKQLEALRAKYDTQLQHWKKEAVKRNGYQKYITLFDRHLNAREKEKALPPKK
jgi:arylsulfatase A-like enzyme